MEVALAAFNLAMDPPDHDIRAELDKRTGCSIAPEQTDGQA